MSWNDSLLCDPNVMGRVRLATRREFCYQAVNCADNLLRARPLDSSNQSKQPEAVLFENIQSLHGNEKGI